MFQKTNKHHNYRERQAKKRPPKKLYPKFLLILTLVALTVIFIFPEITFAQSSPNDVLNQTFAKVASVLKIALNFLSLLLWPVIIMIGGLLQNDILFSGGMEEKMRTIWVEVRNIVNIFFVLGLIGVAFYNVLGVGDDKIKQYLPKIIIGIIAVNFTFLAMKVVLDLANLLTVSIFAIPQSINPDLANVIPSNDALKKEVEEGICTSLYDPVNGANDDYIKKVILQRAKKDALKTKKTGNALTAEETNLNSQYNQPSNKVNQEVRSQIWCTGKTLDFNRFKLLGGNSSAEERKKVFFSLFSKYDANSAALSMAVNLQRTYNIRKVDVSGQFDKLALQMIFSVVLFMIYASAFIALFAVLLVRVIVLWICIIFSPILIFSSKLGGASIPGISDNADKLYDLFVKHVQAPIIIALTMTIGYIMLSALRGGGGVGVLDTGTTTTGLPVAGIDTFRELLIAIATCVVVWMGVFAAGEETLAKGFLGGIKNVVGTVGNFVLKAPQYLPLVPIRKVAGDSQTQPVPLASVLRGFRDLPYEFERRAEVGSKTQLFINSLLGPPPQTTPYKLLSEARDLTQFKQAMAHLRQAGNFNALSTAEREKLVNSQAFKDYLSKLSGNEADKKALINAIREGKEDISKNTTLSSLWTKLWEANKMNGVSPADIGNSTPAQQEQTRVSKTRPQLAKGLYQSVKTKPQNAAALDSVLTAEEKAALDKLRTAAGQGVEQYNKAAQEIANATPALLESLEKKDNAINGGTLYEMNAGHSEGQMVDAVRKYSDQLKAAGISQTQIADIIKKKLAQIHSNATTVTLDKKADGTNNTATIDSIIQKATVAPPSPPSATPTP